MGSPSHAGTKIKESGSCKDTTRIGASLFIRKTQVHEGRSQVPINEKMAPDASKLKKKSL